MERGASHKTDLRMAIFCKFDNFVPIGAPGVTKDEIISVSADGSAETGRSSASGDRVRPTASGNRLRNMPERLQEFTTGLVDRDQNHLDVIENIFQRHLLRSLYLPTEKEEHTIYSRTVRGIQTCEISKRTKISRALYRRKPENQDGHLPRATKFDEKKTTYDKILNEEIDTATIRD